MSIAPGTPLIPDVTVVAQGVAKRFGDVVAVDGLDLAVRRGEVYGFLGRNGAGKTTTIRLLLGLIRPSQGQIHLLGRRIVPGETGVFARVGYLVEVATAYADLTVRENLEIQRRLTGAPPSAVMEAIALLRLERWSDRRVGQLSLGNKQRLSLARALLHGPQLLILDEPANALDPAGIVEIRELLRSLAADRGVTVFLSSHILAEVAQLADRIGIVHEGHLIEEVDLRRLAQTTGAYLAVRVSDPHRAAEALGGRFGPVVPDLEDPLGLRLPNVSEDAAPEVARLLVGAGLDLIALAPQREDLESHFLRATGGMP